MATILTKKRDTTGAPSSGDLTNSSGGAELAVNTYDKRLYVKDSGGTVQELGTNPTSITTGALTASGAATLSNAVVTGGTINNTVIGNTTAQAITGTTVTASTGFTGDLTGGVTGNVTGNLTGNVTGNVTGNLTGNVTASSGSSSFTDVVINGTLNMNAGTTATIENLSAPVNANDAATKTYVDTSIANLVDSSPSTLDTLNELAAALGDDPNFSTTVTSSIAAKLPLAGGTMTGAIAMGTSKITGLGDPTANQDAATKVYVDTADATKLNLSGGTMTGAIAMGTNKVTGLGTPTDSADATTKGYVDGILGSATAAADSAAAAAVSESNAATSETNAGNSETAAAASASAAANSFDSFDDRYLGGKSSAPTLDNDGDALVTGALYFNTVSNTMFVWTGSAWTAAGSAVNGTAERQVYTATSGQTNFSATYDVGYVDVYINGVKQVAGTDFTATDGATIVLTTGATVNDTIDIVAYGAFDVANTYTQTQSDARYVQLTSIGVSVQAYDADTAKTDVAQAFTAQQTFAELKETVYTLGTSGSIALDPANGSIQVCVATGAPTFTDSLEAGQTVVLHLENGDTYAPVWPTVTWTTSAGNAAPTVTNKDVFVFWKVSTTLYAAYVGSYA